ncbi:MAG: Appr-1-p processing protein [Chloroflexi bacterium]|nr:MAG: Appr-1-p processing protein [Chloroflexota bacterium]HDN79088.1 macro domain-containing protein [Chloroflexota bacterium]
MAEIKLLKGDITKVEADAIVNAANNHLWMGGGVAGAIKRAGGKEIEEEAVAKGPIQVGEAIATGAGRLKARYVIHAAAMGYDERGRMIPPTAQTIRDATKNSLLRAEELGLKSIAFPALGTGVGGFPLREAARIMLQTVREHLAGESGLEEVIFVLYGDEAYKTFEEEMARWG